MSLNSSDDLDQQIQEAIEQRKKQIKEVAEERQKVEKELAKSRQAQGRMNDQHSLTIQREIQRSAIEDEYHFRLRQKLVEIHGKMQAIRNSMGPITNDGKIAKFNEEYQAILSEYLQKPVDLGEICFTIKPLFVFHSGPVQINILPTESGHTYVASEGPYVHHGIGEWKVEYGPDGMPNRLVKDIQDTSGLLIPPPTLKAFLTVKILEKSTKSEEKKPRVHEKPKPVEFEEVETWEQDPWSGNQVKKIIRRPKKQ
jgi:hypothetical protein